MARRYVWVRIPGGVVKFEQHEIEAFNREFDHMKNCGVSQYEYWNFFTEHFSEELNGATAYGYAVV